MFCSSCGTQNKEDSKFCISCGSGMAPGVVNPNQNFNYAGAGNYSGSQQMDFGTSIKTCFSKYAEFTGRARRSEYWWFQLFYTIVYFVASAASSDLAVIVFLGFALPLFSSAARRLHDIGQSGWMMLIPIYNIVLLATDSDPAPNQYGVPVK